MKYSAAVFDLDGTILDTLLDIKGSVNRSLERCGMPIKTDREVRLMIGMGVEEFLVAAVPADTPADKCAEFNQTFACEYSAHQSDFTAPFAGINEMLADLRAKGIKIAVVSNKDEQYVIELCEKLFSGVFDLAIGSRPGVPKKPAPDLVNIALDLLGVDKNSAVYIGDTEFDVKTAKNADMDCIAVLWGYRDRDMLEDAGAVVFAETPDELKFIIENKN